MYGLQQPRPSNPFRRSTPQVPVATETRARGSGLAPGLGGATEFVALDVRRYRTRDAAIFGASFLGSPVVRTSAPIPAPPAPRSTPSREHLAALVPYAAVIRSMLERDEIPAARRLLAVAFQEAGSQPELAALESLLASPRITSLAGVRDPDRSSEFRALTDGTGSFRGQWVAVSGAQVVANAPTLKALLAAVKDLQLTHVPLIHRVD